ncbi:MAG TPA: hypothetical protein VFJ02_17445 [Vicinamibacterales bacterium]|nr:hypothetical protein [Vicinamibacterales bacterium]
MALPPFADASMTVHNDRDSAAIATRTPASSRSLFHQPDILAFLALLLLAVVPGILSTHDLEWPYDADGFRDVAIAQHAREGRWQRDPFYAGEAAWYSPLAPAVVAFASAGLGLETAQGYARLGAWVNALAPVAFWLMVRRACGAWPALFAVCAFMFLPGRPPAWASATYSPWFFPSVTAQIPLYAGLALLVTIDRAVDLPRRLLFGTVLAATFLAHAGAGLVLGATALATWAWQLLVTDRANAGRRLSAGLASYAVAAVLMAPFLWPLASRYGFHVLNRAPATWSDDSVRLAGLIDIARPGSIVQALIALWGAAHIFRSRDNSRAVLAAWGIVATAGYLYARLAETRPDLPALVPAFHFFFLLRAWTWVLVGTGLAVIGGRVARAFAQQTGRRLATPAPELILAGVLALGVYPRYLGREAFTLAPEMSRALARDDDRKVADWILANTTAAAVFVADDEDGLRIVGPAGRSVVCVSPAFSNPYVSYDERAQARDQLFALASDGDRDAFLTLGKAHGVTHVLARGDRAERIRRHTGTTFAEVFAAGPLVVFRVSGRPGS